MDFLDPAKKRAYNIQLFIGYFLVAIAIIVAATILLFQTSGYDVDRKTGDIIQNGLVFVSAHPQSADIYLNNTNKGNTDARFTIPAGNYNIELRRKGYRTWKNNFTLGGASIERLVYPFLFPEKLITTDQQQYDSPPAFSSVSPDRHWLVVQQPGAFNIFNVFDLNDPKQKMTTLTVPPTTLTATNEPQTLSLVEWSTDNRHLLVKHTFAGNQEFIIIDKESPDSSINVSKRFNLSVAKVVLRDKKFDQYYVYDSTDKSLKSADLKSDQLQTFLSNVLAFKSYGSDKMLYVSNSATSGKASLQLKDGANTYPLRDLALDTNYLLDFAQFDSSWYVAGGAKSDGRVFIFKNPQDAKPINGRLLYPYATLVVSQPEFISFSENTRFIALQSGSRFAVFDGETNKRYSYDIKIPIEPAQQAYWMDGHRLSVTSNNKTEIFDFDGTNKQTLSASLAGSRVFFDRDYTGLYNIAPSVSKPATYGITRTELIVK